MVIISQILLNFLGVKLKSEICTAIQRNCFDAFEYYSNEIRAVFFRAVVVHKSINFVFSFVSRYITFSSILFLLFS